MNIAAILTIGAVTGFLGGMLGKGGSAIATPLLALTGLPTIIAVAAPLPATVPGTAVAGSAYARAGLIEWRTVRWCLGAAIPAVVVGALATMWIDAGALVVLTDAVVMGVGLRLAFGRAAAHRERPMVTTGWTVVAVGAGVGLISGLLANGGGFLLAPLFITVLHFPIKRAFATSLTVAAVLAIPATVVHAALGHIDWTVVAVFGAASIPLSFAGARVSINTDAARLERWAGIVLAVLGGGLIAVHLA